MTKVSVFLCTPTIFKIINKLFNVSLNIFGHWVKLDK